MSKTIVAALLATSVVALPATTGMFILSSIETWLEVITDIWISARDTVTTPDFILNTVPIDEQNRPDAPADDTANLNKRFYIYHRPPTSEESVEKRDTNSLVKFYIPDAPAPDAEEGADLNKRFYIYHRPPTAAESVEERDLEPEWLLNSQPIDKPGRPSTSTKRDPNLSVNFWTPEAPADEWGVANIAKVIMLSPLWVVTHESVLKGIPFFVLANCFWCCCGTCKAKSFGHCRILLIVECFVLM